MTRGILVAAARMTGIGWPSPRRDGRCKLGSRSTGPAEDQAKPRRTRSLLPDVALDGEASSTEEEVSVRRRALVLHAFGRDFLGPDPQSGLRVAELDDDGRPRDSAELTENHWDITEREDGLEEAHAEHEFEGVVLVRKGSCITDVEVDRARIDTGGVQHWFGSCEHVLGSVQPRNLPAPREEARSETTAPERNVEHVTHWAHRVDQAEDRILFPLPLQPDGPAPVVRGRDITAVDVTLGGTPAIAFGPGR